MRTRVADQVRTALLPVCLAVIVLGILGMHALDHHVTMAMADHSASSSTTGITHQAQPPSPADNAPSLRSAGHPMGDMGDMVMLCIAMLVGTAVGVLLALRLRRATGSRSVRAGQPLLPRIVKPGRPRTGPPYLWEFSVIRC